MKGDKAKGDKIIGDDRTKNGRRMEGGSLGRGAKNDDLCRRLDKITEVEEKFQEIQQRLEENGLMVNAKKTEWIGIGVPETAKIVDKNGNEVKRVKKFKYLGSIVKENGTIKEELSNRIQSGWEKFTACKGALLDKRVPVRLKGQILKTVIRPAMMYRSELWPMTQGMERRLNVNQMMMARRACGLNRADRVPNTRILGSLKMRPITEKIKKKRLGFFGHAYRREKEHILKKMLTFERDEKRKKGRPINTWEDNVKKDMAATKVNTSTAKDR